MKVFIWTLEGLSWSSEKQKSQS